MNMTQYLDSCDKATLEALLEQSKYYNKDTRLMLECLIRLGRMERPK
jgi:hypothetical protein